MEETCRSLRSSVQRGKGRGEGGKRWRKGREKRFPHSSFLRCVALCPSVCWTNALSLSLLFPPILSPRLGFAPGLRFLASRHHPYNKTFRYSRYFPFCFLLSAFYFLLSTLHYFCFFYIAFLKFLKFIFINL